MGHQVDLLPWDIGLTAGAAGITDAQQWEGKMFTVEDWDRSTVPWKLRTYDGTGGPSYKTILIVRNVSTIALLPRRLVAFKAGQYAKQVDGYTRLLLQEGYPVDEFLPAAGVPVNDLFYVVVSGRAECKPDTANANATAYAPTTAVPSVLVAQTLATSTNTTASGCVVEFSITGGTVPTEVDLRAYINNRVGIALSARTTAQTTLNNLVNIWGMRFGF